MSLEPLTPEQVTKIAKASTVLKPSEAVEWWNRTYPDRPITRQDVHNCRNHRRQRIPAWTSASGEILSFLYDEGILHSLSPLYRVMYLERMADRCLNGYEITTSGPKGETIQMRPDFASGVRAMELIGKTLAEVVPQSTPEPVQVVHNGSTLEAI